MAIVKHKATGLYIAERAGGWVRWEPDRAAALELSDAEISDINPSIRDALEVIHTSTVRPMRSAGHDRETILRIARELREDGDRLAKRGPSSPSALIAGCLYSHADRLEREANGADEAVA